MISTEDYSVRKWMNQDFQFVRINDTISDAVRLFITSERNELPVLEGKRMVGIVKITRLCSVARKTWGWGCTSQDDSESFF